LEQSAAVILLYCCAELNENRIHHHLQYLPVSGKCKKESATRLRVVK